MDAKLEAQRPQLAANHREVATWTAIGVHVGDHRVVSLKQDGLRKQTELTEERSAQL